MADDSDEQIRKISEDFKREISKKKLLLKFPEISGKKFPNSQPQLQDINQRL